MRKSVSRTVQVFYWVVLLLTGTAASGQTKSDSTTVIASAGQANDNTQLPRSIKPFYDLVRPAREGIRPVVFYSSDDRFFAGLTYHGFSKAWKPDSSGHKHKAYLHYSFVQKAFSLGHQSIVNRVFGGWNLFTEANYDWVRWTNFYGLGNETVQENEDANYYRIRSREAYVGLGFQRRLGRQSSFVLTPFFQRIHLLYDGDRYLAQAFTEVKTQDVYDGKNFGGLRADVLLRRLDDVLLPTKGVVLSSGVGHVRNLNAPRSFTNYNASFRFYVPLSKRFVLSVENGTATVEGNPEFYQLNSIGGNTLRGFRRERFWGETIFHNNNELYYLFEAPRTFFRGKMGVLIFGDQGRVWKKGELSDKWHYGYGAGLLAVPHHKVYLSAQYGISNERRGFHFTLRRLIL